MIPIEKHVEIPLKNSDFSSIEYCLVAGVPTRTLDNGASHIFFGDRVFRFNRSIHPSGGIPLILALPQRKLAYDYTEGRVTIGRCQKDWTDAIYVHHDKLLVIDSSFHSIDLRYEAKEFLYNGLLQEVEKMGKELKYSQG